MPENPHYAFQLTLAFRDDITGTITQQLLAYLRRESLWWAVKHEHDQNGKVHLHAPFIFEKGERRDNPKAGGRTASSAKDTVLNRCPAIQLAYNDSVVQSIKVTPMRSDLWVASYMQKEGALAYHYMPKDLNELTPYFSELQKEKVQNQDFTHWAEMYKAEKRPRPATFKDVWTFFHEKFNSNEVRIVADPNKLRQRCDAFMHHFNGTVSPTPDEVRAIKRPLPIKAPRYCPCGNGEELEYRRQKCDGCLHANECARNPAYARRFEGSPC